MWSWSRVAIPHLVLHIVLNKGESTHLVVHMDMEEG